MGICRYALFCLVQIGFPTAVLHWNLQDVLELSDQFKKEQGRINYVTPTSYLELITAFTTLLGLKRSEVGNMSGLREGQF